MAASLTSFLETEDLLEITSKPAGFGSPRISFSRDFSKEPERSNAGHTHSSSGEFEFGATTGSFTARSPSQQCKTPPMLSADELFYKGKLLPLHFSPRIRMVQDLEDQSKKSSAGTINRSPPVTMRRERSLRSPAKPSVVASKLKSSSYPPPGYSSRPRSPPKPSGKSSSGGSSRWRDLFGLKKSSSSNSSSSVSGKLLKMIFNRGGSSSASESPDQEPLPLLRDSMNSSSDRSEMTHSSSVSSSSSWAASSVSSDLEVDIRLKKTEHKSRNRGGARSKSAMRASVTGSNPRIQRQSSTGSSSLQRSGSNRKSTSGTRMQLQDHVLIGKNTTWRRPECERPTSCSSSYTSSVRVTPVLHVPACIGPSLRNVRVHGLRKLFTSSSSSNRSGKSEEVAVM